MDNIENLQIEIKAKATGVADELNGLATALDRVKTASSGSAGLKKVSEDLGKVKTSLSGVGGKIDFGGSGLSGIISFGKKVTSTLENLISESNDYIENLNLFTVAMGDYAKEAQRYAEEVQSVMGIDASEWMRNQGVFMTLATGFGVAADGAAVMSESLTELGYDLSSFFNISVEDAMQKLQSGISGEIEPLRRLGYDLSQAKLQQIAYANGIDRAISSMTQAEKAQLRYVAIMTQVQSAHGDLARTLEAPANQLRIFQAATTQAARALGNMFIPALNVVLPYVIGFVNVLTWAAQSLANLFGFALPEIDYSGVEGVTESAGEAAGALGGASKAAKELKNAMLGIDELNVISPQSSGGGGGGASFGGADLGLDLSAYDYDFLGNAVTGKAKEIAESIKTTFKPVFDFMFNNIDSILELAGTLGATILLWSVAKSFFSKLKKSLNLLGQMVEVATGVKLKMAGLDKLFNITAGVILAISGLTIDYQGAFKLGGGTGGVLDMLKVALGSALGVAGTTLGLTTMGVPFGAAIGIGLTASIIVTIAGLVAGYNESLVDKFYQTELGNQVKLLEDETNRIANQNINIQAKLDGLTGEISAENLATLQMARDLTADIFSISEQDNLTAGQLALLQEKIGVLNGLGLDGIQLALTETGEIAGGTKAQIDGIIDSLLQQYQLEALKDSYIEAYKAQYEQEILLNDAVVVATDLMEKRKGVEGELAGVTAELTEKTERLREIEEQFGSKNILSYTTEARKEYVKLSLEVAGLRGEQRELLTATEQINIKYGETMKVLEDSYSNYEKAKEKVGEFETKIMDLTTTISNSEPEIYAAATGIPEGIGNAITDNQNVPKEAIADTAQRMIEEFQAVNDINSPSKVYYDMTKNIVQGIANSFDDNKSIAVNAMKEMLNEMLAAMETFTNRSRNALNRMLGDFQTTMGSVSVSSSSGSLSYTSAKTRSIDRFATGGYPTRGQLFIANEEGPELVGNIGGRPAVASNQNILDAMTRALYSAMVTANSERNDGGGNVNVAIYMNDEPITDAIKRVETRSGTSIFDGGVL